MLNNLPKNKLTIALAIAGIVLGYYFLFRNNGEDDIFPRQRMYPRIEYPSRKDTIFASKDCNFSFTHPTYLKYRKDSFFFESKPANDCWFDLRSDALNSTIYCSYYPITKKQNLDSLITDAFNLTNKHNTKAYARKESIISNGDVKGLLFEVEGPVATPIQFYLTDSINHFLRGALYFEAKVNTDSTAPVLNYIKSDIQKMIEGFKWSKK